LIKEAISAGRHVLVEKPAARFAYELEGLVSIAEEKKCNVRIGFNHRYHRAFRKAKELVSSGVLGDLYFIRARYGHGGRIGYNKEWRANPDISGGGELIDQGSHLIDLSRMFLGDFVKAEGYATNYFWDMPVDDNAFLTLITEKGQTAFLQASCTEWKNTFSFEIYGKLGKIDINGLGGSYGVERLTHFNMLPEMGPPETTSWEYPMTDDSWNFEFKEFLEDIKNAKPASPGLSDAIENLRIINKIYKQSGYDYNT
jgi:predicted dehydrogenase